MTANGNLRERDPGRTPGVWRSLAVAGVVCCFLACVGCSGSAKKAVASILAGPRIDWGMPLLANGGNGVDQFPAKFTFDINATPDCTNDFVAYNTGAAGAPGVAKIVAFNNLYATQGSSGGLCNTDGPSVYWAYDTDPMGSSQSLTSPVLSVDGSKIAFIDNYASGVLRIIQWKAGEGTGVGSPATPDQDISGMSWSACTAGNSCIVSIAFSGTTNDTNSPPFYNYSTDVLYVGDDSGGLHKFTGVFNGTPAEVTTGGWPLEVHSGSALTGPVFDSTSGNILVGDASGRLSGIREVGSSVGSCTAPCVEDSISFVASPMFDAPVVDGTNENAYTVQGWAFSGEIFAQVPIASFHTNPRDTILGGTGSGAKTYNGAFDNTFLSSSPPNVAGYMYVCGKDPSNSNRPALYQVNFLASGLLNRATALTGLAQTDGEACSPVTEVYNPNTSKDWIFFSIGSNANTSGTSNPLSGGPCATDGNGCVIGIDVTGGPSWPPASVTNTVSVPANYLGSTGGIIVDNVSTASQASNIYFSLGANSTGTGPGLPSCNTTAGVGCAVKLTQSTLQ